MTEDIIASISVGWAVGAVLFTAMTGFLLGWWVSSRKVQKRVEQDRANRAQTMEVLMDALPNAAYLVDAQASIQFQNAHGQQVLMSEFGEKTALPDPIMQAIVRSFESGTEETLELPLLTLSKRRLQAFITPLPHFQDRKEALVQIIDPKKETDRIDFSQHMTQMLAHELRTPLTAILGHVEVLNSCKMDEEVLWHRSLGFVNSETERLARLVEDILTLSRLERVPLHIQAVNLRLAAEEAISALYDEAEKSGASLVLQASNNLPRVAADADRLRQVFINLLDNAIKHAPGSAITIRLTTEGNLVKVAIHDTGTGIAQEDLRHIFEPFYRSDHVQRSKRGNGLGLTIVRAIIEQHSSSIEVHSRPGEGTTFAFSLPLQQT